MDILGKILVLEGRIDQLESENAQLRAESTHDLGIPWSGQPLMAVEGKLDGNLASAGNAESETTAIVSVYGGIGVSWADTGRNITGTNRSTDLSGETGAFTILISLNGEWRFLGIDCP